MKVNHDSTLTFPLLLSLFLTLTLRAWLRPALFRWEPFVSQNTLQPFKCFINQEQATQFWRFVVPQKLITTRKPFRLWNKLEWNGSPSDTHQIGGQVQECKEKTRNGFSFNVAFLLFPYLEKKVFPFNHISLFPDHIKSDPETALPIDVQSYREVC